MTKFARCAAAKPGPQAYKTSKTIVEKCPQIFIDSIFELSAEPLTLSNSTLHLPFILFIFLLEYVENGEYGRFM